MREEARVTVLVPVKKGDEKRNDKFVEDAVHKSLTSNLPQFPWPEQALGHSAAASPTRDAAMITFSMVKFQLEWKQFHRGKVKPTKTPGTTENQRRKTKSPVNNVKKGTTITEEFKQLVMKLVLNVLNTR